MWILLLSSVWTCGCGCLTTWGQWISSHPDYLHTYITKHHSILPHSRLSPSLIIKNFLCSLFSCHQPPKPPMTDPSSSSIITRYYPVLPKLKCILRESFSHSFLRPDYSKGSLKTFVKSSLNLPQPSSAHHLERVPPLQSYSLQNIPHTHLHPIIH